jgi:hypothetical protein
MPLRFGQSNLGVLKFGFRIDISETSLCGVDIGHTLRKPCATNPIVDPEQDITRLDGLVVVSIYGRDAPCNLWSERGHSPRT